MCPICFANIDTYPEDATITTGVIDVADDMLNQNLVPTSSRKMKKCVRTPCNHFYHPECLKNWMDQKLECPTCRSRLPGY